MLIIGCPLSAAQAMLGLCLWVAHALSPGIHSIQKKGCGIGLIGGIVGEGFGHRASRSSVAGHLLGWHPAGVFVRHCQAARLPGVVGCVNVCMLSQRSPNKKTSISASSANARQHLPSSTCPRHPRFDDYVLEASAEICPWTSLGHM